jgi:hypothetical protein
VQVVVDGGCVEGPRYDPARMVQGLGPLLESVLVHEGLGRGVILVQIGRLALKPSGEIGAPSRSSRHRHAPDNEISPTAVPEPHFAAF